jgi:xanthine/uracil permease
MTNQTPQYMRRDLIFILKWVIASFGGFLFGYGCAFGLLFAASDPTPFSRYNGAIPEFVLGVIAMAMFGFFAAILQCAVLQQQINRVGWWIPATVLGTAIVGLTGQSFAQSPRFLDNVLRGITIGAVLGVTQWLVLRHKVRQANWWILASVLGWTTGYMVHAVIGEIAAGDFNLSGLIVYGIITGIVMARLLKQRILQPEGG